MGKWCSPNQSGAEQDNATAVLGLEFFSALPNLAPTFVASDVPKLRAQLHYVIPFDAIRSGAPPSAIDAAYRLELTNVRHILCGSAIFSFSDFFSLITRILPDIATAHSLARPPFTFHLLQSGQEAYKPPSLLDLAKLPLSSLVAPSAGRKFLAPLSWS